MADDLRTLIHREAERCAVGDAPWETIRNRIVSSSPVRNRWARLRYRLVAAVSVLLTCSVTVGVLSPAAADVLNHVPVIGSILQTLTNRDPGLEKASEHGFETPLHMAVEDKGVRVTLLSILADPVRTNITYQVEFPKSLEKQAADASVGLQKVGVELNNSGLVQLGSLYLANTANWQKVAAGTYRGRLQTYNLNQPNHFTVTLHITQIAGIHGNWDFTVPVSMANAQKAEKVIKVNRTKHMQGSTITIEDVEQYPTVTAVRIHVQGPIMRTWLIQQAPRTYLQSVPEVTVVDNKGHLWNHLTLPNGTTSPWLVVADRHDSMDFLETYEPVTGHPQSIDLCFMAPQNPSVTLWQTTIPLSDGNNH